MRRLLPSFLELKVIAVEATRPQLGRALGEAAPGWNAAGLRVPPPPEVLGRTPRYLFHGFGVERKRRRPSAWRLLPPRLQATVSSPRVDAYVRVTALPGIGPWTAAKAGRVAFGDPDAINVGDYHLSRQIAFALAGEPRADQPMPQLLEPTATAGPP